MNRPLSLALLMVAFHGASYADDRNPQIAAQRTVLGLFEATKKPDGIEAASNVDWQKLAAQKRHSMSPKKVQELFSAIDIKAVRFKQVLYPRPNDVVLLRMVEPISYDFELWRNPKQPEQFVLVGVHP